MFWEFVALLAAHWASDFVLQTHWQASNKSKNWNALTRHVAVYTAAMTIGLALIVLPDKGLIAISLPFAGITFVTHFATDAITSRVSSHFYAKQDWHNFFVVIGFDQLIHQVTLAATLWWLITQLGY